MLQENKRLLVFTSLVILLPVLAGCLLWNRLPDPMVITFSFDNAPSGFGSKPFAVFGIPLFILAGHWLCLVCTAHDPRRQNISNKIFRLIAWICPAAALFAGFAIYPYALGMPLDVPRIGQIFIGLLFVVIGNLLPKCRQSYTVGIKLPWTLHDSENWNRTHRLAGILWFAGGLLILLLALMTPSGLSHLLPFIVGVIALVPAAYSFLYALRQEHTR